MAYRFEWDEHKARSNRIKQGVTFDEASSVFDDSLARIFDDELHSGEEDREDYRRAFNKAYCLFVSPSDQMRESG
jgi:uncharacterized DUF497 family protein